MTRMFFDGSLLIEQEPDGRCELCGARQETRPYGPNGEEVCFSCGMKDEDAVNRAFMALAGWEE